eukprot:CAMPEP_0175126322 /NCGR_PEP_ID=MMETSP0087-20121206/3785_1 /TAXON_ID=136419 /ORGANISM="Unknown Unknown, Strain D1" /LENGTH=567 /DNA_ID=CAMNT_0016408213 /DNA_START=42 /DNA_END=1745 /DNA_ORIENTATION=+
MPKVHPSPKDSGTFKSKLGAVSESENDESTPLVHSNPLDAFGERNSLQPAGGTRVYQCGFRKLGAAVVLLFLMAVLLGMIITLTASNFSKTSDKIWIFFKIVNPCVFFDHHPAKIVALAFVSFLMIGGVLFAGLMWLWVYAKGDIQLTLYCTLTLSVHVFYLVQFINAFAYDLYKDGDPVNYGSTNSTHLSEADIQLVSNHTGPYLKLIFADILFMVYELLLLRKFQLDFYFTKWSCGFLNKVNLRYVKLSVLFFLMGTLAATFASISGALEYKEPKVSLLKENSMVMWAAYLSQYIFASTWSVVAQLGYRLFVPSDWRVKASFSLSYSPGAKPEVIVSLCFRFLLVVTLMAHMYTDPSTAADSATGESTFTSAFQKLPGVLIFAPASVMIATLMMVCVFLTYVHISLTGGQLDWPLWRVRASYVLAVLFCVNLPLVCWRILPEPTWAQYLDHPLFFLFIFWSFASHDITRTSIVYFSVLFVCMVSAYFHWIPRLIAILMLCFYSSGHPEKDHMWMQLEGSGGRDLGFRVNPNLQQELDAKRSAEEAEAAAAKAAVVANTRDEENPS